MEWGSKGWFAIVRSVVLASACGLAPASASAQWLFEDGFENACEVDTDGDRLADCDESARGTHRKLADSDEDGLLDGDEVLGTQSGLDLPAMGIDPLHKDLLVEIDWAVDSRGCAVHSHQPPAEAIAEVKAILAAASIANPDGSSGINLIVDTGQGVSLVGGSQVAMPLGAAPAPDTPEFDAFRAQHSDPRRVGYVHYQVHAHTFAGSANNSGSSEIGGDDTVVTVQCHIDRIDWIRNTILHELGHNLGLRHGGADDCNMKPNYNSLMSYLYQLEGIDADCDGTADGEQFVDYSRGTRVDLDPLHLIEAEGICGADHPLAKPIDWNGNGVIDTEPVSTILQCGHLGVVTDHDDFSAMALAPSLSTFGQPINESAVCAELP